MYEAHIIRKGTFNDFQKPFTFKDLISFQGLAIFKNLGFLGTGGKPVKQSRLSTRDVMEPAKIKICTRWIRISYAKSGGCKFVVRSKLVPGKTVRKTSSE